MTVTSASIQRKPAFMHLLPALIAALLMLPLSVWGETISPAQVNEALKSLDNALGQREKFIANRRVRIDSLKNLVERESDTRAKLRLLLETGEAYKAFRNDSAARFYFIGNELMMQSSDTALAPEFAMKEAIILPLLGLCEEAAATFETIDASTLPDSLYDDYHEAGRQMYSYIASTFSHTPEHAAAFAALSNMHRDSLLSSLPTGGTDYALHFGEKMLQEHNDELAKSVLINLLQRITPESPLYARACHMLATIARREGHRNTAKYYLALSAQTDVRNAVLEVMALQELGAMLAEDNDITRGYDYLTVALQNAVECHAMMRIVQSSESLPLIQQTHQKREEASRNKVMIFLIVMIVLVVLLLCVLIILYRQMAKMSDLQERLSNANSVKEVYISQFFRLCSIYIDRLNQFCQLANRKISSGQVDELYKITKSGRFVEEQSEEFYRIFDDAFLHMFPTFVEDVNALLTEKIVLKEGELLNNELRILAFMRLGVDDTNKVAIMLNYSVNTIYAYRNRLRNRALNRDTFEADIMKIKGY